MSTITVLSTAESLHTTTTAAEITIGDSVDALDNELREISLKVMDLNRDHERPVDEQPCG